MMTAQVTDFLRLLIDRILPPPRSELRVWVGGHDRDVKRALVLALANPVHPPVGVLDAAFVVAESIDEAAYFARKLWPRLDGGGSLFLILSHTESVPSVAGESGDLPREVAELITELNSEGLPAASVNVLGDSCLAVVFPAVGLSD